ncbi:MAG: hypothetical protein H6719_29150 [Sandaracinaceae bacterium]|nr:hypothetical protein [Sandaracinaceae bacterium]
MTQRASVSVPAPSPRTSMNLGNGWSSQRWTSDGFTVNTRGRVWLDANGTSGSSTLTLLSNGDGGTLPGQLLVQSLQRNLHLMSQHRTIFAGNESLLIAGQQSVKISACTGLGRILIPFWSATRMEGETLKRVAPDEDDPSSDASKDFVDTVESWVDMGAFQNTVTTGLALVCDSVRWIMSTYGSGGRSTLAATIGGMAIAAKVTAALVSNTTHRQETDGVKGLHMASVGSTNIGTVGFGGYFAGLAHIAQAVTVQAYGSDLQIIAGVSAGLRSLFNTRIDGSEIECTAGGTIELAARCGQVQAVAFHTQFGGKPGEGSPFQRPTDETTLESWGVSTYVPTGKVELSAGTTLGMKGGYVEASAVKSIVLKGPNYTVTVNAQGVAIDVNDAAKVKVVPFEGVNASVNDLYGVEVAADGIFLGSPSNCLSVDSKGVWEVRAPLVQVS